MSTKRRMKPATPFASHPGDFALVCGGVGGHPPVPVSDTYADGRPSECEREEHGQSDHGPNEPCSEPDRGDNEPDRGPNEPDAGCYFTSGAAGFSTSETDPEGEWGIDTSCRHKEKEESS